MVMAAREFVGVDVLAHGGRGDCVGQGRLKGGFERLPEARDADAIGQLDAKRADRRDPVPVVVISSVLHGQIEEVLEFVGQAGEQDRLDHRAIGMQLLEMGRDGFALAPPQAMVLPDDLLDLGADDPGETVPVLRPEGAPAAVVEAIQDVGRVQHGREGLGQRPTVRQHDAGGPHQVIEERAALTAIETVGHALRQVVAGAQAGDGVVVQLQSHGLGDQLREGEGVVAHRDTPSPRPLPRCGGEGKTNRRLRDDWGSLLPCERGKRGIPA